nr:VP5 protein [Tibet orbivirus]WFJ08455.1 VP5 [Tibet orbivirus]
MGKIIKSLNKIGKKVGNALTSSTAKKIYKTIGKAAERFAESEIGSATIDGLVQGSVQSILTGESYGETVKQAIILKVLGAGDDIPDPISPGEVGLMSKVRELEEERKAERVVVQHNKKLIEKYGNELTSVRDYIMKEKKAIEEEENQIEILDKAIGVYGKIVTDEESQLQKLKDALMTESAYRTREEARMVADYRERFEALRSAIEIERDGMQEEAIQEIAGMTADVLEAAAEEVPIAGAGMAAAIASARAVEGAYKLKEVITALSGIDLAHLKTPKIHPETLALAIDSQNELEDAKLAAVIDSKLKIVKENNKEIEHITKQILPAFKEQVVIDNEMLGEKESKKIHPQTVAKFMVPLTQQPLIHIYSAPWDSDYVFMLHCVSHHHRNESFFLGFDLELEIVYFEDLTMHWHALGSRAQEVQGRTFREAYQEFLYGASKGEDASAMHKRRLVRSRMNHPIYLGKVHYDISYEHLKSNALAIVHDEELQLHLLRGPIHFQRRAIMGALQYGIAIMDRAVDLPLFLRNA